jgi:hypothetical protein
MTRVVKWRPKVRLELRTGGTDGGIHTFFPHRRSHRFGFGYADRTQVSITNDNTIEPILQVPETIHTSDRDGGGLTQRSTLSRSSLTLALAPCSWSGAMDVVVRATECELAPAMTPVYSPSVTDRLCSQLRSPNPNSDSLGIGATGFWDMTPADTGVLQTDLIGLYTAIPEPSTRMR